MTAITKKIVQECLQVILVPIARFCVRNALPLKDLTEIMKKALIQAAVSELRNTGQPISVSKIHVMSGVPRLEVNRIYVKGEEKDTDTNVVSRVIARWQQDKRFLTKSGKPRVLETEGMESDFVKLVTSVSINLNPYTVLFELERTGSVTKTSKGVKLTKRIYVPGNIREGFQLLAEDVEDLMEAVRENLEEPQEVPNHHIKTEYENIPARYAEKIRHWFYREGSAFHQRARNYISTFDRDINPEHKSEKGDSVIVSIGSFSRIQNLPNPKKRTKGN